MIDFLLASSLLIPAKEYTIADTPEPVARYCAQLVGIPYASDNFSNREWDRFKDCVYMQMEKNENS